MRHRGRALFECEPSVLDLAHQCCVRCYACHCADDCVGNAHSAFARSDKGRKQVRAALKERAQAPKNGDPQAAGEHADARRLPDQQCPNSRCRRASRSHPDLAVRVHRLYAHDHDDLREQVLRTRRLGVLHR